jgi:hypothetical protein
MPYLSKPCDTAEFDEYEGTFSSASEIADYRNDSLRSTGFQSDEWPQHQTGSIIGKNREEKGTE